MTNKQTNTSTHQWCEKFEEEFIQKHIEEKNNLDLFKFVVDKLDTFRVILEMNSGLSPFNKSHIKIINKIDKTFEEFINNRLSNLLHIKNKIKI